MSTVEERDELAAMLVPIATELAFNVHVGDAAAVRRVLEIVAPDHLPALCVVLAGLVDIDQDPAALLAWIGDPDAAEHRAALEVAHG